MIMLSLWNVSVRILQVSKSNYLSIVESATHKTIINKMFFNAPAMNKWIKDEDILNKYPKPTYYIVKECY